MCSPTGSGAKETDKTIEIDARCIVEFRPKEDWDGEYGFDWYRIGDYKEKPAKGEEGINTQFDRGVIGKYRVSEAYRTSLAEELKKYQEKYGANPDPDLIGKGFHSYISFSCDERYQKRIKEGNYSTRKIAGIDREYIIPSISISEKKPTNITVLIKQDSTNIEQVDRIAVSSKGDFIHFGKDNMQKKKDGRIRFNYIELKGPFTSNPEQKIEFPIELVKPLTQDWTITAYAQYKDQTSSLVGLLDVVKTDPKQINVCLVNCKYLSDDCSVMPPLTPDIIKKEIYNLKKYLSQAQVIPNITVEELTINTIDDIYNTIKIDTEYIGLIDNYSCGIRNYNYYFRNFVTGKLENSLIDIFEKKFNNKHKDKENDYKIFFIDGELFIDGDKYEGCTRGEHSKSAIVAKNHADWTACHELLHCFGLFHSFSNRNYYTYKKHETSNLMDYNRDLKGVCLWRWQWRIIKKLIKDEKQSPVIQKIRNKTAK